MGTKGNIRGYVQSGYDDLAIVGFDGMVLSDVHCDESLAIVQSKSDSNFAVLSSDSDGKSELSWFGSDDLQRLLSESRLTLLPEPVEAFPGAVVLYATEELLRDSGYQANRPTEYEPLHWQRLRETDQPTLACCISRDACKDLLNHLTKHLLTVIDENLIEAFVKKERVLYSSAKATAEMALDAVRDKHLAESIYLRLGVAMFRYDGMEQLLSLYSLISSKYPKWRKESFLSQVIDYAEIVRAAANFRIPQEFDDRARTPGGLSPICERILTYVTAVEQKCCADKTFEPAFEAAERFCKENPEALKLGAKNWEDFIGSAEYRRRPHVYLKDEDIQMLATNPICYHPDVIRKGQHGVILDLEALKFAYEKMGPHCWWSGSREAEFSPVGSGYRSNE